MRVKAAVWFGLRTMVLALVLFGLYPVDALGLSLSEEVRAAPVMVLLVSLLQAAVLHYHPKPRHAEMIPSART
jgi:hypothetical protein